MRRSRTPVRYDRSVATRFEVAPASADVLKQVSLFGTGEVCAHAVTAVPKWLDDRTWVLHQPGWLRGSDNLFEVLRDELRWHGETREMYGRTVAVPRLVASVDAASHASLSLPFEVLRSVFPDVYATVGVNMYRSGRDSVAWHSDDVGRHRSSSTVLLVSLGATRALRLRPKSGGSSVAFTQHSGDLFVMGGAAQARWEHQVPKSQTLEPRISIGLRSSWGQVPIALRRCAA